MKKGGRGRETPVTGSQCNIAEPVTLDPAWRYELDLGTTGK